MIANEIKSGWMAFSSMWEDGRDWPSAAHDSLLNLFFALQYSLAKELNALRLDDAPWQGFWSAKNRFFTQPVEAPLRASPSLTS